MPSINLSPAKKPKKTRCRKKSSEAETILVLILFSLFPVFHSDSQFPPKKKGKKLPAIKFSSAAPKKGGIGVSLGAAVSTPFPSLPWQVFNWGWKWHPFPFLLFFFCGFSDKNFCTKIECGAYKNSFIFLPPLFLSVGSWWETVIFSPFLQKMEEAAYADFPKIERGPY